MNKINTVVKTTIAGLACVTLCGGALAAPHGHGRAHHQAPTHQKAPAPVHHGAPMAHHAPAPCHQPPPPPPPPAPHHGGHHECGNGLVTLGAAVIGGIVGGIVGACR